MMDSSKIETVLKDLRAAQRRWRAGAVRERAQVARRLASLIAESSQNLHEAITSAQRRSFSETLSTELLPLAEAARWLARDGFKHLRDRTITRRGAPLWLGRIQSKVVREPFGVVLIIGTWNYPIFLVGVQAIQAMVAGNAIVIKPAPGCDEVTKRMRDLLVQAGFPTELIFVSDSSLETAKAWVESPVEKLVMTGSSRAGRQVLTALAQRLTPAVMELSGCDAMILLDDFSLPRVVDCLVFTLRMNGGATCLAPRRVLVPRHRLNELEQALARALSGIPATTINADARSKLELLDGESTAKVVYPLSSQSGETGGDASTQQGRWRRIVESGHPLVVSNLSQDSPLAQLDIFAPFVMLMPYDTLDDALAANANSRYALTCSIFGDESRAIAVAGGVHVGAVTINDVVVPTADPRLPFGGVQESGFGVTRGVEGLLEMTFPKVIAVRRGGRLRHLEQPVIGDEKILEGLLQFLHAERWSDRWTGIKRLMAGVRLAKNATNSTKDVVVKNDTSE